MDYATSSRFKNIKTKPTMTLTELRQKWKPILEVREVIPQEEIEQYKKDIEKYKIDNPDWQLNTVII